MSVEIVIALITFFGSVIGTVSGIVISSKLVNHRLKELEKKQDKHNSMIERMFIVEGKIIRIEEELCK